MSLSEMRDVRRPAITTLRNLLAKHAFDDRYSSKVRDVTLERNVMLHKVHHMHKSAIIITAINAFECHCNV